MKIYSNYHLYKVPYYYVETIRQFDYMHDGVVLLDEIWRICDCVTSESQIITHNDVQKVTNVIDSNPLQSVDLENMKVESSQITHISKRLPRADEKLVSIKTKTNQLTASRNHRLFVFDGVDVIEKHLKDIREGEYVLEIVKTNEPDEGNMDLELAQFLGYVFGDGTIYYRPKEVHWSSRIGLVKLEDMDKELLIKYGEMMNKKYKLKYNINKQKGENLYRLTICNRKFVEKLVKTFEQDSNVFLDKWGLRFKEIPESIVKSNNKILGAFLRGLFDAEAFITFHEEKSNIMANKKGIHTRIQIAMSRHIDMQKLKYLLLRFGIRSTMHWRKNSSSYSKDARIQKMEIRDRASILRFHENIGFYSQQKKETLEKCVGFIKNRKIDVNHAQTYPFQKLLKSLLSKICYKEKITISKIEHTLYDNHRISHIRMNLKFKITKNHTKKVIKALETEYGEYEETKKIKGIIDSNITFEKVISIAEVIPKPNEYLYDMEVPTYENYIANGFLVHNSRLSRKASNKFVADILARSRKRHLVYIFTCQVIDTIDKRIRKVMDFCNYCQIPSELIITNSELKQIVDVNIGDKVLTHTGTFQKVTDTMNRDYDGDLYTITPDKIKMPIKMTAEHPIFIVEPTFKKKYNVNKFWTKEQFDFITKNFFTMSVKEQAKKLGINADNLYSKRQWLQKGLTFDFKWVNAKDVEKIDLIAYPIIKETNDMESLKISDYYKEKEMPYTWTLIDDFWKIGKTKIPDKIKVNNDFLKLLGYYVGDGSAIRKETEGGLFISLNRKHEDRITEVESLFKNVFGLMPKTRIRNGTAKDVFIHCQPIKKLFIDLCGQGSENKKVPQWVLTLPIEKQQAFLDGYLATDGHKLKNCGEHRFSAHAFSTVSKLLATQLTQIILRLGYKPHIEAQKTYYSKNGMKINGKLAYHGYISKQNGNSFIQDSYYLMPIMEIKKENYKGKVYNIEVVKDNSYTTRSICLHNCVANRTETVIKVLVFRTGYVKNSNFLKTFYYTTEIPFMVYDSNEEVDMEDDSDSEDPCPEPKLMWQEGLAKCTKCGFVITMSEPTCPECEGKSFEEIKPIFFDSWEAADRHAAAYWEKKFAEMKMEIKDD